MVLALLHPLRMLFLHIFHAPLQLLPLLRLVFLYLSLLSLVMMFSGPPRMLASSTLLLQLLTALLLQLLTAQLPQFLMALFLLLLTALMFSHHALALIALFLVPSL